MAKFNYMGELCGGRRPMLVTLPITTSVDVEKGTAVFYSSKKPGVTTTPNENFAGITAEDYTVQADEHGLNPKAGSGKVLVILSKSSVYKTQASTVVTANGSMGPIGYFDINSNEDCPPGLVGSKFILIEKSTNYDNTNEIGTVHTLKAYVFEDGDKRFGFDNEISCDSGDKYLFIPNAGFENMSFDENGDFAIDLTVKGNITVVGSDAGKKTVDVRFN